MNYSVFDNADTEAQVKHEVGEECDSKVRLGGKDFTCRLFHKMTIDDQHEIYANDASGKVVRITWQ